MFSGSLSLKTITKCTYVHFSIEEDISKIHAAKHTQSCLTISKPFLPQPDARPIGDSQVLQSLKSYVQPLLSVFKSWILPIQILLSAPVYSTHLLITFAVFHLYPQFHIKVLSLLNPYIYLATVLILLFLVRPVLILL